MKYYYDDHNIKCFVEIQEPLKLDKNTFYVAIILFIEYQVGYMKANVGTKIYIIDKSILRPVTEEEIKFLNKVITFQ